MTTSPAIPDRFRRLWTSPPTPVAPFSARTWSRLGYLFVQVPFSALGFVYAVLTVSLIPSLLITLAGLYLPAGLVHGARGWGAAGRSMLRWTGLEVAAPAPLRRGRRTFLGTLVRLGTDPVGWKVIAHQAISLPWSILSFTLSATLLGAGLGGLTYPFWRRFLPAQMGSDGQLHRGSQLWPEFWIDTPGRIAVQFVVAVVCLFLWPVVQRGLIGVWQVLGLGLLGPSEESARVEALTESRERTVTEADARLHRIERDLHDGTQARLVSLAMQLGEARELLDSDPDQARDLLANAHGSSKDALVELREIARGIRPPALEAGLGVALETLAARSPLPVTVDVAPDVQLAPALEAIAYFCVAELVTNAAKHADATGVYVLVARQDDVVRLRVRDDGHGGAVIGAPRADGHGSGLAGLRERVRSVDGDLTLSSPAGGPTVVDVVLPARRPRPAAH